MKLIGRPPVLENGYPDMARNHTEVDYVDIARRWNGGGLYVPMPPPPPIPTEKPEPPMVSEIVNEIKTQQQFVRSHPSSTSSVLNICGTTEHHSSETTKKDDFLVLDHEPLKRLLRKLYPWILDVTEVRIKPKGGTRNHFPGAIYFGPLEIHITVSPTHHSELMNPAIEKKVREKLYLQMLPLITCMYENNTKEKPIIIFSPIPTETILEYIK